MHSHGGGGQTKGSGTEQSHKTVPELQLEIRSLRSGLDALSTRLDKQAALIAAQAERLEHIEGSMPTIVPGATGSAQDSNPKGKSKGYMGPKGSKDRLAKGKKAKLVHHQYLRRSLPSGLRAYQTKCHTTEDL